MKSFKIIPTKRWYINPSTKARELGVFVRQNIDAFYHDDYHGGNAERRIALGSVENIITTLKNQFLDKSVEELEAAGNSMLQILISDLPEILFRTRKATMTVCVIPRSKAESTYSPHQLVFKLAVKTAVDNLNGLRDGTNYILRHTNTRTTHLDKSGYGGDGDLPYPGITKNTCSISEKVRGEDVLLIDDLYTETVNIDEDAIQALLDCGAKSVIFYSLGKTAKRI